MDIKKVVIPVAGLGKRFLPISRTIPKAMMPLFDRPILDYAISEALESVSYTHLTLPTNREV